jgi:hypothetical protein
VRVRGGRAPRACARRSRCSRGTRSSCPSSPSGRGPMRPWRARRADWPAWSGGRWRVRGPDARMARVHLGGRWAAGAARAHRGRGRPAPGQLAGRRRSAARGRMRGHARRRGGHTRPRLPPRAAALLVGCTGERAYASAGRRSAACQRRAPGLAALRARGRRSCCATSPPPMWWSTTADAARSSRRWRRPLQALLGSSFVPLFEWSRYRFLVHRDHAPAAGAELPREPPRG